MKKAFFLLLIPLLCACQNKLDSGLIAYFPFDGDAEDRIGNALNCTVDGATLSADRFGNEQSAYYFDGEDDQIYYRITNMPALEAPQSLCWWYMGESPPRFPDPRGAGNMIVLADSSAGLGIQFGFRAPGYETLGFDGWNWGGSTLLEADTPALKVWHFCVYTFDGVNHCLYIDGRQVVTSTKTTQQGIPAILMFGNYPGGDQFLKGVLDDIRIYDRALTDPEINMLYIEKNK